MSALPLSNAGCRAVIVGCASYGQLEPIPAASQTLSDLRKTLVEVCGLPPEHITEILNPPEPRRLGIAIAEAAEAADDVLVFYYIGHGLLGQQQDLFLAQSQSDERASFLPYTALRYDHVRESVLNSPARVKIVVLDCCFAGTAVNAMGSTDNANQIRSISSIKGATVLAAAAYFQHALAPAGERYTAFSGELLNYLRNGDAALGEYISLYDLISHLEVALPSNGFPKPQHSHSGNSNNIILACNSMAAQEPELIDKESSRHVTRGRTQAGNSSAVIAPSAVGDPGKRGLTGRSWTTLALTGILLSAIGTAIYSTGIANFDFIGKTSEAPTTNTTSSKEAPVNTPQLLNVDWRNHTYHVTCDGLAESGFAESSGLTVDLHDGSATVANPINADQKYFYRLRAAIAGDVTGDGRPETIVLLSCEPIGANYYREEVQVFTSGDTLLGELPSPQSLQGDEFIAPEYVPVQLRIAKGEIVAGMLFYRVGASHAEGATIPRTLTWRWTGSLFEQVQ